MTGNHEDAQDLAQDALIEAYQSFGRFERGTPLLVILRGHENSITRTFLVRAVRVQSNPDKTWTIGCQFTSPLSDLELKALV